MTTPIPSRQSGLVTTKHGQLRTSQKTYILIGAILISVVFSLGLVTPAAAQVAKGQVDDFEDATTQGWQESLTGLPSPNPPTNVATGGPDGAGDNYLQNISAGFGKGGKITQFNQQAQWTGDYIAAGIKKICAHAKVEATSDQALSLRVGFQTAAMERFVTLIPVVVPKDANWYEVMLPINSSSLVPVSFPNPTYTQVMSSVNHFRIFHSEFAAFQGAELAATLGLDNIRAWGSTRDWDGDCKSDTLWRNQTSGQVNYWGMNGASIDEISTVDIVTDTNWKIVGTGDYNGDGMNDVMWRHQISGQIVYWQMNGNTVAARVTVGIEGDTDWKIVGSGDHDGDGNSDLLWHHATTGQVYYWKMNGGMITSAMNVTTVTDTDWQVVGSGDLNGDGMDDLLWRHSTSGQINYWQMNGAAVAANLHVDTVSPILNWKIVGVGDYNGDGRADVYWHNQTNGKVWCWGMNGAVKEVNKGVTFVNDLSWQVVGNGDYNGDGLDDLLWHYGQAGQQLSGQINFWQMNGREITSISSVSLVSDLDWQIVNVD